MDKQIFILVLLLFFSFGAFSQNEAIVPLPNYMVKKEGQFTINAKTKIVFDQANDTLKRTAEYLNSAIAQQTGYRLVFANSPTSLKNCIVLKLHVPDSMGKEGYILKIRTDGIEISSEAQNGLFYGIQSLIQMLPFDRKKTSQLSVNCIEIIDSPRFSWRGMMLDCSRYFFSPEFIKKLLDNLALHKINTFHWHLTDDQGWRIEIKAFPKLTSIGASRNETLIGHKKDFPEKLDGKPYGGFYTQNEIKEIVNFAKERFITVIPEIEMPGHAQAAIAAYPWLGSTDVPTEVATKWGVKPYLYNPFDTTFYFLEKVLSEVFDLFPGEYIHIGGDEAVKEQWKSNSKIQDKIRQLNLKDENELQSWFIKRIQKYAQSKGKKIMGWDEITEGGAPKDAAIMYWRSDRKEPLEDAVRGNHPVVVTPKEFCYLDYYQAFPPKEQLAIGGYLTLDKIYTFEPVPQFCTKQQAQQIMGAQANLWTEYIPTAEHAEYMLFPRLAALSEVVWTEPDLKDYQNFSRRLKKLFTIYDLEGINYCKKNITTSY